MDINGKFLNGYNLNINGYVILRQVLLLHAPQPPAVPFSPLHTVPPTTVFSPPNRRLNYKNRLRNRTTPTGTQPATTSTATRSSRRTSSTWDTCPTKGNRLTCTTTTVAGPRPLEAVTPWNRTRWSANSSPTLTSNSLSDRLLIIRTQFWSGNSLWTPRMTIGWTKWPKWPPIKSLCPSVASTSIFNRNRPWAININRQREIRCSWNLPICLSILINRRL